MREKEELELTYKELFPNYKTFEDEQEWKKEGDIIQEFTLFEDYPPSYSTCYAILNE